MMEMNSMDEKLRAMMEEILRWVEGAHASPAEGAGLKDYIKDMFREIDRDYGRKMIF